MAKVTCPHCGASVDSSRTVCPNCRMVFTKKRSLTPYLIIAGLIIVIAVILAIVLLLPSPAPAPLTVGPPSVAVKPAAEDGPSPPCTIAITGRKNPPASIQLQVMTTTCYAGDITELRVSVNGQEKGTLGSTVGASGTFSGTSGSNNVVVAAKFSNGAESVVFQNAAL